jgi:hypothetical protein
MKTATPQRYLFSCKVALRAIGLVFFTASYYFGIQISTQLILGSGRDGEEEEGKFILPERIKEQDKDAPRLLTGKQEKQGKPELDSTARTDTLSEQAERRNDAEPQQEESSTKKKLHKKLSKQRTGQRKSIQTSQQQGSRKSHKQSYSRRLNAAKTKHLRNIPNSRPTDNHSQCFLTQNSPLMSRKLLLTLIPMNIGRPVNVLIDFMSLSTSR